MVAFNKLFTSRFKYLFIAWGLIVVFVLLQMKLVGYYNPQQMWRLSDYIIYTLIQLVIGCFLILLYVIPLYDYIKNINSVFLKGIAIILHALVFGILYIGSLSLTYELKAFGKITTQLKERVFNLFFTDLHNSIKTYLIFIAILYAHDFFKKNAQSIIKQKSLENEMDKVKLQSLRAQLQPHFLFNALNNVVALIDENKRKAQESLIQLSDLLRYTVNLEPYKLVTINEEIETLKTYINIEKAKYETQLKVTWDIPDKLDNFMVPPLIIQPLVENAIKHGFKNNDNQLSIKIRIKKGLVEVKNNGSVLTQPINKGNGLRLVEKRLNVHYGDKFLFSIHQNNEWIVNSIELLEYYEKEEIS